ncbi:Deoxycytidine deaminase Dcd [Methanonatronarchaeum thermophilum]|uniref:Deoxycytidine deaminase Dcd n=1 Tax=Methanonatronarchaeum thermophilum TaxID=1927129 RepID=A0A1Y3GDL9_9EURY|nr:hypothetical protein [Methanonatronarchaeum thermophilum]OUJ19317.1 Deoxycytidine deaminase Dcd [Methanonatronarchaeum thermophilum]
MAILSESKIREKIEENALLIEPFSDGCLQPASYDLRVDQDYVLRGHCLVSSLETVGLPMDVAGLVRMRSTFGREGVFLSGGYIDPGYKGDITLCLFNAGDSVEIGEGERIAQIVFFDVVGETGGYSGSYQNSCGVTKSKR